MALDPPTLGEVMRRIDDLVTQIAVLAGEMKQDRAESAKTYVRQDLYLAQRQADSSVVADLNGEIQTMKNERVREQAQRRQMVMWLGGLTVTVLFGIAGLLVSILTLAS